MTTSKQDTDPVTKVQAQAPKATAARHNAALSPELREVLHMLKSLEAELDSRQAAAR
jgi:hypothetical protein